MNRMPKMILMALGAIVFLSACQTTEDFYGKGPLPNRSGVATGYAKYLKTDTPMFFLVSDNGAYGYSYCTTSNCSGSEYQVAIDACRQSSKGVPCWVYARGRKIVWDETASRSPSIPNFNPQQQPSSPPVTTTAPNSVPSEITRPIAVRWEGYPSLIAGTVQIREKEKTGEVSMVLPNNDGKCVGAYQGENNQGTWSVACTNGLAASGTFRLNGQGIGSTGAGKDTKGRSVEFTVGGPTADASPTPSKVVPVPPIAQSTIPSAPTKGGVSEADLKNDFDSCMAACGPSAIVSVCQVHCGCLVDKLRTLSPAEYLNMTVRANKNQLTDADAAWILACRNQATQTRK